VNLKNDLLMKFPSMSQESSTVRLKSELFITR